MKRVLIDPGHSEKKPGARMSGASIQEEDLNRYQAIWLTKILSAHGIQATIYDPIDDDLVDIGRRAKGYDAFVSLHLNSSKNIKAQYTCTCLHSRYQKPDDLSAKVASEWAVAVGQALAIPVYKGSPQWPTGVMALPLSVLNAATLTECPICLLSEAFFISVPDTKKNLEDKCKVAMTAAGEVLAKYLLS
jgi:N-acetylmuramoyl-L-alanine amidase